MQHTIKVKLFMQNIEDNIISGTVIERDGVKIEESVLDCGNHIAVCRDIVFGSSQDITDKVITITISE